MAITNTEPSSEISTKDAAGPISSDLGRKAMTKDAAGHNQRPRGPAKAKRALAKLIEEYYPNYSPLLDMVGHAKQLSEIAKARPKDSMAQLDAVTGHDKIAKYLIPQLKAVDLTSGGEQITFGFQMNLAVVVEDA